MRRKRVKKLPTGSASSKKPEEHLHFMNVVDCERETLTNNTITEFDQPPDNIEEIETGNTQQVAETNDPTIIDPQELDENLLEEPNGDGENILKVFKKNLEERSKLISSILDNSKEQSKDQHPINTFFQSMAMTVRQFSPANQIRARMEICKIVSQLELAKINQAQNDPQHDARSSSASRDSTFHSLGLQYDARTPSSASIYTIQSPSIFDEDYDFVKLNISTTNNE
ncbi:hypothetical protein FQR65_LT11391 [Abscondita terminalis]|nr:hypothetical protein FQR65_LT11391 [Abscondita terminalis]